MQQRICQPAYNYFEL